MPLKSNKIVDVLMLIDLLNKIDQLLQKQKNQWIVRKKLDQYILLDLINFPLHQILILL